MAPGKHSIKHDSLWTRLLGSNTKPYKKEKLENSSEMVNPNATGSGNASTSASAGAEVTSSYNTAQPIADALGTNSVEIVGSADFYSAQKTTEIGLHKSIVTSKTQPEDTVSGRSTPDWSSQFSVTSGSTVLKRRSAINPANKNAYTLMEMLMAVGIIVILMGISMVSVATISKSLEITRLDDIARQIYVSVQNQLALEKASGELLLLRKELYENHSDTTDTATNRNLTVQPKDFFTFDENVTWESMYWLSNEDTALLYTYLFDNVSFEKQVLEGCFIIEFDPASGDCYSVFYSDEEFDYSDITELADRERSTRKANRPMLGYYNGSLNTIAASNLPDALKVEMEVVNKEELYVKATVSNLLQFVNNPGDVSISFNIEDEGGHKISKKIVGGEDFSIVNDSVTVYLLLDSIEAPFSEIAVENTDGGTTKLTPGDNLTVEAKAEFNRYGVNIAGSAVAEGVSSLYAKKTTATVDDGSQQLNLEIAYLRHLNNLRLEKFDLQSYQKIPHVSTDANGDPQTAYPRICQVFITQTQPIDFLADNFVWQIGAGTAEKVDIAKNNAGDYEDDETDKPAEAVNPLLEIGFAPINNMSLNFIGQTAVYNTSYDGNGHALANFEIVNDADDAAGPTGLFGGLANWELNDIILTNPNVSGTSYSAQEDVSESLSAVFNNAGENYDSYLAQANKAARGAVGALAGTLINCKVTDCGVYLTTADKEGTSYLAQTASRPAVYQNMMEERVAQHRVKQAADGSQLGGLVGYADNTEFSKSYAAINVWGGDNSTISSSSAVGGFIGDATDCTFASCYASGEVAGTGESGAGCGGFAGNLENSGTQEQNPCANSCYSTSNVRSAEYAGGFVGTVDSTSFDTCIAYGKITKNDEDEIADPDNSGGFYGSSADCSYGKLEGGYDKRCRYLYQSGYNDQYDKRAALYVDSSTTADGVLAVYYKDLRDDKKLTNSEPYDLNLYYENFVAKSMPLQNPTDMTISIHHGNWPLEYTILLALAYYERYADGEYGYYCETKLSDGAATQSDASWQLDTLREKGECVEDGYVLLSVYQLSKFTYELDNYGNSEVSVTEVDISRQASGTDPDQKAVLLKNEDNLIFNAVDPAVGAPSVFEANKLYVYQLPLYLQGMTYDWLSFTNWYYHKLCLREVYATGSSSQAVLSDYTFYYNPHFAKSADNPDPFGNSTITGTVYDPESNVAVRSARQLNCLGRYAQYWNEANIKLSEQARFNFVQEIDINYGTYVKTYCGANINFMNTESDNDYRNLPIGRPMGQAFLIGGKNVSVGSFQNNYDGQGNQIIDYCQETYSEEQFQFCGLFGEISGGVLENIVMTASAPENQSAYVKSAYTVTSNEAKVPGIGALVGLMYLSGDTDIPTRVENCAISGMTVVYTSTNHNTPAMLIGGLCGVNMGVIKKCSAVCKTVQAALAVDSDGKNISIGGLCGSNMNLVDHCYAGGNLSLVSAAGNSAVTGEEGHIRIGGVCGGTYGLYYAGNILAEGQKITTQYCYSYCNISQQEIAQNPDNLIYFYGVAEEAVDQNDIPGSTQPGDVTTIESYYLSDTVPGVILRDANNASVKGVTIGELSGFSSIAGEEGKYMVSADFMSEYSFVTDACSYPWSSYLKDKKYPFPAVVTRDVMTETEAGGTTTSSTVTQHVHYGDWPEEAVPTGYLVYWERYSPENDLDDPSDDTYGLYFIKRDGAVYNTLAIDNFIIDAGYGILTVNDDRLSYTLRRSTESIGTFTSTGTETDILSPVTLTDTLNDGSTVNTTYNELLELPAAALADCQPVNSQELTDVPVSLYCAYAITPDAGIIVDKSDVGGVTASLYSHMGFAAGLHVASGHLGVAEDEPYQVRYQYQLAALNDITVNLPEAHLYFAQTRSFAILDHSVGEASLAANFIYDGNPNLSDEDTTNDTTEISITGLKKPLFAHNAGQIKNTMLRESKIIDAASGGLTCALAVVNSGLISNCVVVEPQIQTSGDIAGLVWENSGEIQDTRLTFTNSDDVKAYIISTDGNAAGFVGVNTAAGNISNCTAHIYTVGTEPYAESAAGFVLNNAGTIDHCDTIIAYEVHGQYSAAGFVHTAEDSAVISDCTVALLTDANVISRTASAAGFVHTAADGAVISNCTVSLSAGAQIVSQTDTTDVEAADLVLRTSAAGFAVSNNEGAQIVNCQVIGTASREEVDAASATANHLSGNIAAGFVVANTGSISGCGVYSQVPADSTNPNAPVAASGGYKSMKIAGTTAAAGFAYDNANTDSDTVDAGISNSFAVATVTAASADGTTGGSAAGFAVTNTNGAISRCYANCLIYGADSVGFANNGTISSSYALGKINDGSNITAGKSYGFTVEGACTDCYSLVEIKSVAGEKFGFGGQGTNTKKTVTIINNEEEVIEDINSCFWAYEAATWAYNGTEGYAGYNAGPEAENNAQPDLSDDITDSVSGAQSKTLYEISQLANPDGVLADSFIIDQDGIGEELDSDTGAKAIPYATGLQGKYYPYPVLAKNDYVIDFNRYGDWPEFAASVKVTFYAAGDFKDAATDNDWLIYRELTVAPGTNMSQVFTEVNKPSGFVDDPFAGWKATSDSATNIDNLADYVINASVDFYTEATLKPYKLTINYVSNTPAGSAVNNPYVSYGNAGEPYSVPSPTVDGYTLVNQDEDNNVDGTFSAEPQIVTVEYHPVHYTLSFDTDGGTLNGGSYDSLDYTIEDQAVALPTATKDGFDFTGWKLEENSSEPTNWQPDRLYSPEKQYAGKYGDVTMVAQFTPRNYTLTLNYNEEDTPTEEVLTYAAGSSIQIPDPTYEQSKKGYILDNWIVTSSDGSWTVNADIQPGEQSGQFGNATLTAQWEKASGYIGFMQASKIYRVTTYSVAVIDLANNEVSANVDIPHPIVNINNRTSNVYLYFNELPDKIKSNAAITVDNSTDLSNDAEVLNINNWNSNNGYSYIQIELINNSSVEFTINIDCNGIRQSIIRTVSSNNNNLEFEE